MSNQNLIATSLFDVYIEIDKRLCIQHISCSNGFLSQHTIAKKLKKSIHSIIHTEEKNAFKNFLQNQLQPTIFVTLVNGTKKLTVYAKKSPHPTKNNSICIGAIATSPKPTIIQSLHAIVFTINKEGIISSCSTEAMQILGKTESNIIGKKIHQLIHKPTKNIIATFKESYTSKTATNIEAKLESAENKLITLNFKFSKPSITADSYYKTVIGKDITDWIAKRELLEESELRFRKLAESLPLAIGCVSKKGDLLFVNEAANKLFGINLKTTPTLTEYFRNFYPTKKEAKAAYERWLIDIRQHKSVIPSRISKIKLLNGQIKNVEVTGAITNNYIYYYYTDITAKVKYEDELINARDYFKSIAEHLPKPVAICDKNFDTIFLNKEFIAVFGYTIKDIPNLQFAYDIVVADTAEERQEQKNKWAEYIHLFTTDKLTSNIIIERQFLCKDQSIKYFEIALSAHDGLLYAIFNDVTLKKKQEKLLLENELKFRKIIESVNLPITCTNLDLEFLYINNKFSETFNLHLSNINDNKLFFKRVVFKNAEEEKQLTNSFLKDVQERVKSGKNDFKTYQIQIYDAQNNIRTFELSVSLQDNLLYFLYIDITDRIAAEKQLRASEQRFKNISDNTPLSICTFDLNMNITYINNRFKNLVGYTLKEVGSVHVWPKFILHKSYEEEVKGREEWMQAITDAINGKKRKKPNLLERTIICKDGSHRVFDISFTVENQKIYAVLNDVTERRLSEALLFESEQRFKALAEKMPIAIASYNLNEKVNFVNNYFEQTIGYSLADIPTLMDWYKKTQPNPETRDNLYHHWKQTIVEFLKIPSVKTPYIETQLKCKDGSFKTFNFLFSIHESDVFVILVDITKRRKAELELIQSHVQLRELASHLQKVREEERKYISREIHDELGQLVTGLKMDISMCKKLLTKELPSILPKIDGLLDLTDTIVRTVRRISSELRPGIIDDIGLIPALQWQAKEFEKRSGIKCAFTDKTNNIELDFDAKNNLFRIFQESLTNIMRHANASKVEAITFLKKNTFCLTIKDNGIGFSTENKNKTLGILGMKERTIVINGTFEILSFVGVGTTINIEVPI